MSSPSRVLVIFGFFPSIICNFSLVIASFECPSLLPMYAAIRFNVKVSLSVSFFRETKIIGPSGAMAITFL